MAWFKRRGAAEQEAPDATSELETDEAQDEAAEDPAASGPFDVADRPDAAGTLDFGSIRLPLADGFKVTVEVARETGQPVSVVVSEGGSRMQLTAFAAPKRAGLWQDARRKQISQVAKQGGTSKEELGRFGAELQAQLPTTTTQGRQGKQTVRFIGVDGPRWLLRAAIGGKGARDAEAAEPLEDLFSQVVVVRGDQAMPPGERLPLRLPSLGGSQAPADGEDQAEDPTALLRRGPEITEVR
ncbi:MAG: DUF3710 domain-containing protein [Bifidobacteriaceae bacterium]|jgi:hypothetical protein|nr:DUF3710 domain-containing protein [Bifidobacteriaceae bacterium]